MDCQPLCLHLLTDWMKSQHLHLWNPQVGLSPAEVFNRLFTLKSLNGTRTKLCADS